MTRTIVLPPYHRVRTTTPMAAPAMVYTRSLHVYPHTGLLRRVAIFTSLICWRTVSSTLLRPCRSWWRTGRGLFCPRLGSHAESIRWGPDVACGLAITRGLSFLRRRERPGRECKSSRCVDLGALVKWTSRNVCDRGRPAAAAVVWVANLTGIGAVPMHDIVIPGGVAEAATVLGLRGPSCYEQQNGCKETHREVNETRLISGPTS